MLCIRQFLYKKKLVVVDLPDSCIQNMILTSFISMVVLTTKTLYKKNKSGHAEYFVPFV